MKDREDRVENYWIEPKTFINIIADLWDDEKIPLLFVLNVNQYYFKDD